MFIINWKFVQSSHEILFFQQLLSDNLGDNGAMMKFGPLVGSIDEGTSSARFMIFKAASSEIVCFHQLEVPSIYPQEGWVEQDPMILLDIVEKCIAGAVKKLEEIGGSRTVSLLSFLHSYR